MTCRVAAVDCGTNSLRLLLADVDPGRAELTDVIRRMEIVRLGQGVDETGWLAPELHRAGDVRGCVAGSLDGPVRPADCCILDRGNARRRYAESIYKWCDADIVGCAPWSQENRK